MNRFFTLLAASALLTSTPAWALNGDGTAQSPFTIASTADWSEFAAMTTAEETPDNFADKFLALTADVDFTDVEFAAVGSFAGTFDGAGFALKGIEYSVQVPACGIFTTIEEAGTVKNLTIAGKISASDLMEGKKVVTAGQYLGGLVGSLYGSLDNCVNTADVTSTSSKGYVAGLVGHAFTGASLTSCTNKGTIQGVTGSSAGRVGGLVALSEADVTYTDCVNEGLLTLTEETAGKVTAGKYVGGIAAEAFHATFTRCVNKGEFEVADDAKNITMVAGILAFARSTSSIGGTFTFTDCTNESDISCFGAMAGILANSDRYAGQLITNCDNYGDLTVVSPKKLSGGQIAGIAASLGGNSTVEGCVNEGTINSNLNQYAAGIVATCTGTTETAPVLINNCQNLGDVICNGGNAGGIAANPPTYTFMTNCFNSGNISGSADLGGIAGSIQGKAAYVDHCYNIGKVTGTTFDLGGIAGKVNGMDAYISNCWNAGDVESTSTDTGTKGGYAIGGIAGTPWYTIENCYNLGTVKGASAVGGIGGNPGNTGGTMIKGCYNAGAVIVTGAPDTNGNINGGGIIGIEGRESSYPDMSAIIVDCYFCNQYGANRLDNLGTGLSMAEMTSADFALIGENMVAAGQYCLPTIKGDDSDAAKLYSAAVVIAKDETYSNITSAFNLGTPAGIEWVSDCAALAIEGNNATFAADFQGEINLVASLNGLSRVITVNADATAGIDAIKAADAVSTRYIDLQGRAINNPAPGMPVIKIDTMTDGSVKATKHFSL